MIRASFALPEHSWVRSLLVNPGRCLEQILFIKDQLFLGAGFAADPFVGNLADDSMADPMPRQEKAGDIVSAPAFWRMRQCNDRTWQESRPALTACWVS